MKNLILLLRPQQWLKNVFIFVPLFFGHKLLDWNYLWPTVVAFFAYCFIASSIYCFNDIHDVEADRKHPKKCKRPIASGAVSIRMGYIIMIYCVAISLGIATFLPDAHRLPTIGILVFYFLMNIAYCVKLKQLAIVDIFIIAIGFVLRILVGGFSTGIYLSHWIVMMTFLLALFLAFAKRRDDVVLYENTGELPRKNINRYNIAFMNQAITVVSSLTMVCYIMYCVSPEIIKQFGSNYVYITSVFVLAAIIRYLQITIVDVKSGSPTKVLVHDHFIQLCILLWVITFFIIIYVL